MQVFSRHKSLKPGFLPAWAGFQDTDKSEPMKKYLTVKGNFYPSVLTSHSERQFFHRTLFGQKNREVISFWVPRCFDKLNINIDLDLNSYYVAKKSIVARLYGNKYMACKSHLFSFLNWKCMRIDRKNSPFLQTTTTPQAPATVLSHNVSLLRLWSTHPMASIKAEIAELLTSSH